MYSNVVPLAPWWKKLIDKKSKPKILIDIDYVVLSDYLSPSLWRNLFFRQALQVKFEGRHRCAELRCQGEAPQIGAGPGGQLRQGLGEALPKVRLPFRGAQRRCQALGDGFIGAPK